MITKKCLQCGLEFNTYQSRINIGKGKYCSRQCTFLSQVGKESRLKGVKKTPEQKSKMNLLGLTLGRGWNKGIKTGIHHNKQFKKGNKPWNFGFKGFNLGHKATYVAFDDKNPAWMGDEVGYGALHDWVRRRLGTPTECSFCGKIGTKHQIHWANVDHKYKRDINDWIRLCAKCHKQYDKNQKLSITEMVNDIKSSKTN